jgi:zinc D-Ala-D-Ala carboxypeptidase
LNLTPHFTLEEMTFSDAGSRLGIDNTPEPIALANLELVAACMEKVRALLGSKPIVVHSGYRAPAVNKAVGGVATSAHCLGLACDFVCPEFGTPYEIATTIEASDLDYDQLILEYGWVHVGLAREGALCRREALTKHSSTAAYESGIRA